MKKQLSILTSFLIMVLFFSCAEDRSAEIATLTKQLEEAKTELTKKVEAPQPKLIHTVFFWLKEGLKEDDIARFKAGVKSLSKISHIQTFYMGPAADTEERDVVDNSYDLALICQFAEPKDQDAYQIDPIHLKFIEDCKDTWTKVVVYDNLID